jgi:hypothetical protein
VVRRADGGGLPLWWLVLFVPLAQGVALTAHRSGPPRDSGTRRLGARSQDFFDREDDQPRSQPTYDRTVPDLHIGTSSSAFGVVGDPCFESRLHTELSGDAGLSAATRHVLLDGACSAIDALSVARARIPLESHGDPAPRDVLDPARRATLDHLTKRHLDDRSILLPEPCTTLNDLFATDRIWDPDPVCSVLPYDASKVDVVHEGFQAVPLFDYLDGEALDIAMDPDRYLLLPPGEVDEDVLEGGKPYTDPNLRKHTEMVGLVKGLIKRRLACPRRTRNGIVGVFTVKKKERQTPVGI